jgi:hypothetical protein
MTHKINDYKFFGETNFYLDPKLRSYIQTFCVKEAYTISDVL